MGMTGRYYSGSWQASEVPIRVTEEGYLLIDLHTQMSGERQSDSVTGSDHLAVAGEWAIKAIAYNGDLTARTIYNGPCLVAGIEVTTAMSAHASQLEDNGVSRYPIPASRAAGIYTFPGPVIFETDCVWDPGSLSAGAILVWYRPLDQSVTWAY